MRSRRSTKHERYLPAVVRLQGLFTLLTVYSLRAVPALFQTRSAYGIDPSELCSSQKVSLRFRRNEPACRLVLYVPTAFRQWRSAGRDFRALTLSRIPGFRYAVNASKVGCSLGVCLSRFAGGKPCNRVLTGILSHAWQRGNNA